MFFPKSSQSHFNFVETELEALTAAGAVRLVADRPLVISPLSVAENGAKPKLILDLSWLNQFVAENRFSLPSVDKILSFVLPIGGYTGSFDF
jgi:hypothetical protein